MIDQPRPRTWWRLPRVRVSVRALMGLVLVLAVWLGWYVHGVHVQQDAVAAIKRAGGSVTYDWEWGNYNPDIINYNGKSRAPKWLAKLIPVDYVSNVVDVHLTSHRPMSPSQADDETLAHVGRLGRLESLWLDSTTVTDAGLAQLRGLTGLRHLFISRTSMSDAGLVHLKGMPRLVILSISGSRVTDEGLLDLERALPTASIYRQEDQATSADIARTTADLEFARSRPVRVASALLVDRARKMADRRDAPALIATLDALCDLEAVDKLSLLKLAEARTECLGILEPSHSPSLTASQRRTLQRRCTDRGIDALTRAVELGYDNVRRLEGEPGEPPIMLWYLHDHPDFPKLIAAMKAKRPGR